MKISPFTREKLVTLMGNPAAKEFCDTLEKALNSSPSEVAPRVAELDRNISSLSVETAIAVEKLQCRLDALEATARTVEDIDPLATEPEPNPGPGVVVEPDPTDN